MNILVIIAIIVLEEKGLRKYLNVVIREVKKDDKHITL
jgi:hypothetical protein